MLGSRALRIACLLIGIVGLAFAGTAQAQFRLTWNNPSGGPGPLVGGQAQIGTGLPLPVGQAGIFTGGTTMPTAGTPFWPPLLVRPIAPAFTGGVTVMQTGGPGVPQTLMVPAGILARKAAGSPNPIAVFPTNMAVFQVATSIDYAWPAVDATFAPGGAPVGVFATHGGSALPGGGTISYGMGASAFGGPGQFAVTPGSGAAGGRVPPNGAGVSPVASVWICIPPAPCLVPTTPPVAAIVGASAPAVGTFVQPASNNTAGFVTGVTLSTGVGLGQVGAPVSGPVAMTAFGPLSNAAFPFGAINPPTVGPNGTIVQPPPAGSIPLTPGAIGLMSGLSNMVTGSKGWPWATAKITIMAATGAMNPAETFFLSGADSRAQASGSTAMGTALGSGNISMVSGATSARALSENNANRGWVSLNLTMPEPGAMLGAGGALAMLGLCHGLLRRRSR